MGMLEEAMRIKKIHPTNVLMFKSGNFYKVFGKDSYILSSLLDYQINKVNENIPTVGFPLNSIYKVRLKLEEEKINYMVINPRNNYYVDTEENFKNLNNYEKEFEIGYKQEKNKKKIRHITAELQEITDKPYFKEVIRKMEDVLDEARQI